MSKFLTRLRTNVIKYNRIIAQRRERTIKLRDQLSSATRHITQALVRDHMMTLIRYLAITCHVISLMITFRFQVTKIRFKGRRTNLARHHATRMNEIQNKEHVIKT